MQTEEFEDVIVKNCLYEIERTLGRKAEEYARGDRLSNFKKAAHLLGCTPERALLGFVAKHLVALADFVNDLEDGKNQSIERWNEKTRDISNYMVLLEALNIERWQQERRGVPDIGGRGVDPAGVKNETKMNNFRAKEIQDGKED